MKDERHQLKKGRKREAYDMKRKAMKEGGRRRDEERDENK